MSSIFDRWRQRQSDLRRGGDADLIHTNRNRYRLTFVLLGFGLSLSLLTAKVHIPKTLRWVLICTGIVSLIVGFLFGLWARSESAFLNKPDPVEPPRIFRP